MTGGRVTHLFIYPIKSCRGMAVSEYRIVRGGPEGDRRFMVVTPGGAMLSQRTHPELARVACHFRERVVEVTAEGQPSLALSVPGAEAPTLLCQIWKDEVMARLCALGSEWFSRFLGESVCLVHIPADGLRDVNPERAKPGDQVGFADGYPLLWTNQASLDELQARATEPVGMERFRPNLVTSGLPAFAEDTARVVSVGEVPFEMPKLCDRCVVTTTDQMTGTRKREPLRALAGFRRWDKSLWFGANLIPRDTGTVRVGDPVRILEVGPHPRDASTTD